jgi:hypothetical protein
MLKTKKHDDHHVYVGYSRNANLQGIELIRTGMTSRPSA